MTAIYITEPGSTLNVKHHQFQVLHKHELHNCIPVNQVRQITMLAICHLSRQALKLISSRQIPLLFVSNQGQDLSYLKLDSEQQAKYLFSQRKRCQNREFILAMAESLVWAKLYNESILLQQLNYHRSTPDTQKALSILSLLIDDLPTAKSVEELRDYDATASTFYYPALASWLPSEFGFQQRKMQPPTDQINQMLNLGYALLHQQTSTFVEALGLDTDISHLHIPCQHQKPLVCDLMAEFRPLLVDELVVKLASDRLITPEDLTHRNGKSGEFLSPQTLKIFIKYWEEKLQTKVTHPYAGTVSYLHCLELQVREYIACVLGDVEFYRPLLLKPLSLHVTEEQKAEQPLLVKL